MRKALFSLLLASVPLLLMLQVLQAYRYVITSEEISGMETLQEERLEENRRLVAGIAVFDSPERVYSVATGSLELEPAAPEKVLQVRFPDEEGSR